MRTLISTTLVFFVGALISNFAHAATVCNSSSSITNVRSGPSAKNFGVVGQLKNDQAVKIIRKTTNAEGYDYYEVEFASGTLSNGQIISSRGFVYHEAIVRESRCGQDRVAGTREKSSSVEVAGSNKSGDFFIAPVKGTKTYQASTSPYARATMRIIGKPVSFREKTCTRFCIKAGTSRIARIPVRMKIELSNLPSIGRGVRAGREAVRVAVVPYAWLTSVENGKRRKELVSLPLRDVPKLRSTGFRLSDGGQGLWLLLSRKNNYSVDFNAYIDVNLITKFSSGGYVEVEKIEDSASLVARIDSCGDRRGNTQKDCRRMKR